MDKSARQRERMLHESIPKLVSSISVPAMFSQLISIIYNTADTYFISQINKSASAAVGACFAIMALIQAVGFGFAMGSCALSSIRLGENKDEEAYKYSTSAFFGAFSMGLVLAIFGLTFLEKMLIGIGCSTTMLPYAKNYIKYILINAPIACSMFVLEGVLRSEGQTKLSMIGIVTGGILNMILDPLLIFYFDLGISGAAIATAISQIVSFLILYYQFYSKRTIIKLKICYISKKLGTYKEILTTGFPTICRQGIASVATALLNNQAVIYGDAAVAAISIANKAYMLIRNMIIGIGQGYQPVAGYNYGAKNYARAKRAFEFATAFGTVVCLIATVVFFIFRGNIMWWFCKDEEVLIYGKQTLAFLCISLPTLAFSTYVNQFYQCLGFKVQASLLALCRQGFFFIPIVLILPQFIGVVGVEATQPLADMCTCLISIPFIIKMYTKYLKEVG